jgi:two-component system chemotaxis response regulator CheB
MGGLGTAGRGEPPWVVALVGSAGSWEPLARALADLGPGIPAAVLVLMHVRHDDDRLAPVLGRLTGLPLCTARPGQVLRAGAFTVAPADRHLLVAGGRLALSGAPAVRHVRPSGDVLLTSMSQARPDRAVGVVLSGMGSDGARGAEALAGRGGRVLVQDPATARFASMPRAALAAVPGAAVLPPEQLGSATWALVRGRSREPVPSPP